nr:hypothetical protein [uncultured bacterium]
MRCRRRARPSELGAQQDRHRACGASRIHRHAVGQRQRGIHRISQRLRVGLHHHRGAEPGSLYGRHEFPYRELRRHFDQELICHRTVLPGLADNVQGHDVGSATADGRCKRPQLAGLIGHIDMQPPQGHGDLLRASVYSRLYRHVDRK